jgi:trimeric autotransporter adhesin
VLSLITYRILPADSTLPRITDFVFYGGVSGASGMLYSSTRYGGVLSSWSLTGSALTAFASTSLLRPDAAGAVAQIGAMQIGGIPYLMTGGGRGGEMVLRALNFDGSYGQISSLGYLTQFSGDLIGLESVTLANGTTAVYGGILGKSGIGQLNFDTSAHLTGTALTADTTATHADRVVALAQATIGGQTYLFSASTETYFAAPGVTAWQVGANGSLTARSNIDAADGLWIAAPTALAVAHVGPQTFLIVAAAGTGSLTVVEVGAGGALRVASHVLDDLNSRFAGVTALATLDLGGRSFVVAGGSDDGITLFQVLPGGRLLALETLADTNQIGLTKISALQLRAVGNGFDIFAASSSEPGITQLHYALGTEGIVQHAANTGGILIGGIHEDTLIGLGGNDQIDGGAGNDIISDGGGSDVMRGGAGADVFLLAADGVADTIVDFTPGQDKLDLSAWGMLRNIGQLQIDTTAHGAMISFGDESLTLINGSGQPIQAAALGWGDLYNLNQIWMDLGAPVDPASNTQPPEDLIGSPEADVLAATGAGVQVFALAGNDSITSDVGNATLFGGADDDRYFILNASDQVREAVNAGFDRVFAGVDYVLAAGQEIELLGALDGLSTTALGLTGNELSQTLIGNAGTNIMNTGGGGADILRGGAGDDTYYVFNSNDRVYEAAGQGFDRIFTTVDFALVAYQDIELLSAANTDMTTALNLSGNSYSQTIIGNAGINRLSSGLGSPDILIGDAGDDVYYVYNALDQVREANGEGFDRVFTAGDYTLALGQSVELLGAMIGSSTIALSLTGNELAQTIIGNAGANTLRSGTGFADIMIGGAGNDTYYVSNVGDQVLESAGNGIDRVFSTVNYVLTAGQEVELLGAKKASATTPLHLTGNEKSQTIIGNAGNNALSSGGGAADTLLGGFGDDTYYVFNPYDRVNEAIGAGNDSVFTTVTYALTPGQEIEMLSAANAASTTALYLYGNEFSQTIIGNVGQNRLSSGLGNPDVLIGGLGNDTYYIYNSADDVVEGQSAGFDKVFSAISYTLPVGQYIELLGAIRAAATEALNLTGNELSQTIIGNAGDNILSTGGGAADVLMGSLGNDRYYVYNSYDRVYESIGNGIDHVFSTVNYALAPGQEIELLSVTDPSSTYAISLAGNSFSQEIIGNAGNNTLSTGGGAADTLSGGAGNDIYYIYNSNDKVIETTGNGFDRVFAAVNYTLEPSKDIEVLAAISSTATTNLSLSGNELAQTIIGNAGTNTLRTGGGAADVLFGGAGNDLYYISNVDDRVIEAKNAGIDTVLTSVSYAIAAGQEIEILSAQSTISTLPLELKGNELAQTIIGNSGPNILNGGGGSDILTGGAGADIFVFTSPIGTEIVNITDFQSGSDKISLDASIFPGLSEGTPNQNQFTMIGSDQAHNTDAHLSFEAALGRIWFDPDGTGEAPAIFFAELRPGLALTQDDFFIFA